MIRLRLCFALIILGCNSSKVDSVDDSSDLESNSDTGSDTGSDPTTDEDVPLDGFGTISGDCGLISFPDSRGELYRNAIDFGSTAFDSPRSPSEHSATGI